MQLLEWLYRNKSLVFTAVSAVAIGKCATDPPPLSEGCCGCDTTGEFLRNAVALCVAKRSSHHVLSRSDAGLVAVDPRGVARRCPWCIKSGGSSTPHAQLRQSFRRGVAGKDSQTVWLVEGGHTTAVRNEWAMYQLHARRMLPQEEAINPVPVRQGRLVGWTMGTD
jgi:hypothetical protein